MDLNRLENLGGGYFAAVGGVHTFGTDALLLADFAAPKKSDAVCDLCSGCGIVPLLLLKKQLCCEISAVEIQKDACELIEAGVRASSAEKKISVINHDLRSLKAVLPANSFSLITVNPPYYSVGSGPDCTTPEQQAVRSESCCTVADIAGCASRLLKSGGRMCLCHKPERLADVICALREKKLEPKRLRFVAKSANEAPWLFLLEARLDGRPMLRVEKQLNMNDENELERIYGGWCGNSEKPLAHRSKRN